jgi:hypothetical protein
MTPITTFFAGLQIIASWLLSALSVIAIILSVILCLAFVECVWAHGSLARAYTVKINSPTLDSSPGPRHNKV